jgi:UDP-glucose 4-epimerase
MPDRVLLIGAGGFIGQALCSALVTAGYVVRALSRTQAQSPHPQAETVTLDCKTPDQLAPLLEDCQTVIYLAASSTPGGSAGHALAELDGNLRPLLALLEAMQTRPNLRLLYFSSAGALYGDSHHSALGETADLRPRSYHGAGKVAAEQFIGAWTRQFQRSATILRPSNVYGPGQPERPGFGIIRHAFGAIRRGETLKVWGDGSAVRDYLYIDDLVTLTIAALDQPSPYKLRIFNVASGETVSLNDLFQLLELASGQPLLRHYEPGRTVDADRIAVDADKARAQFGWQPSTTLAEGLKHTWNWLNTVPLKTGH